MLQVRAVATSVATGVSAQDDGPNRLGAATRTNAPKSLPGDHSSQQAEIVDAVPRVDSGGVSDVRRRDPRQLFAAIGTPSSAADQKSGDRRAHSKVAYRHSALDALCDLDF